MAHYNPRPNTATGYYNPLLKQTKTNSQGLIAALDFDFDTTHHN